MQITKLEGENTIQRREGSSTEKDILIFGDVQHGRMVYRKLHFETHLKSRFVTFSPNWMLWGFRTMPISVPGHADHRFRDDRDHGSGMMPITHSGMIPIS
jgi:hypothetical protein